MNYGQGGSTPYLHNNTSTGKKIAMIAGIFLAVIVAIIIVFNLFFNDDAKKNAFDRAIQGQLTVSAVADLANQYSDSPSIESLAATSKSVAVSNASTLSDMKGSLFGERYVGGQADLTAYQQELAQAERDGTADTLARDLLTRAAQSALNDLDTLHGETSSPQNRETIEALRGYTATLVNEVDSETES